jgi:endonuclease/exonuclease/phosphatase family metal-dependent hydrolase
MGGSHTTIFCLQEVSHDWAGSLHTFFANHQYHLVTALYGKKFNGYMGIALAYPTFLETVSVDLCRLSDKRIGGWPRPPVLEGEVNDSWSMFVFQTTSSWIQKAWKLLPFGIKETNAESDPWSHSEDRQNMLITLGLRFKETNAKTFWVSNYHMPCAYYAPMVMNMHVELAAKRVQTLAGTDPYILAGDWNILPTSPHYQLAISATLPKEDPSYPTPKFGVEWKPTTVPMRSAYAEYQGKEPDFTNYAKVKDDEPFIETLDYIFLSPHWSVSKVKELPNRKDVLDGPFPNADQPSDHLLIAADLQLTE